MSGTSEGALAASHGAHMGMSGMDALSGPPVSAHDYSAMAMASSSTAAMAMFGGSPYAAMKAEHSGQAMPPTPPGEYRTYCFLLYTYTPHRMGHSPVWVLLWWLTTTILKKSHFQNQPPEFEGESQNFVLVCELLKCFHFFTYKI